MLFRRVRVSPHAMLKLPRATLTGGSGLGSTPAEDLEPPSEHEGGIGFVLAAIAVTIVIAICVLA